MAESIVDALTSRELGKTKCGAWPVCSSSPVRPWNRLFSLHYLSRIGCSRFSPLLLGSLDYLYRPSLLCTPSSAQLGNEIAITIIIIIISGSMVRPIP